MEPLDHEDRDRRRRHLRPRGRAPAHARARGRRVRGPAPTRAATRTRCASTRARDACDVDTGFIVFNDRNYPHFERLLAGSASPRSRRDMSFGGQRRTRRLRVRGTLAERAVRQARAPRRRRGSTAWSPTSCASTARRARCSATATSGPSLGDLLERARLLARVRRAADRAAGLGGVVGRPAPDVDLPGALPGRVLRQPRDARLSRPPAVAHGRRRLAPLRRGARRARSRERVRLAPPVAVDRAPRRPRRGRRRAAASRSASTTS